MYGIGIDESNNGLYPLIYSACISSKRENFLERKLVKRRSKDLKTRLKTFKGFKNNHIIFTKDFEKIINYENYKMIAIGEFSRFYSEKYNVKWIYMDGEIEHHQAEKIFKMLHGINKNLRLKFGKDLDIKLRIVNEADNWANLLFRYYRDSNEKNKTQYLESLLHPNIRDYEEFLV